MYPVRKFNVAEAAYSTNLRLKMQEAGETYLDVYKKWDNQCIAD